MDTRRRLDSTELKIKNNTHSTMPVKDDEGQRKAPSPGGVAIKGGRNSPKPYHHGARLAAQKTKFEGRCKVLKGHVYDICGAHQANQFMKTTEEIGLYVGQNYPHGGDIGTAVRTLERPVIVSPEDPLPNATMAVKKRWEDQLKRWGQQLDALENNITKLYNPFWGQCSDALRAKIVSQPEFAGIHDHPMEGIELLKLIKAISFKFEPQVYKPLAIDDAIHKFVNAWQGKKMATAEYLEHFQNNLDVLDAVEATIGPHRGMIDMITGDCGVNEATPAQITEANEPLIAVVFINKADKTQYGRLVEDLWNNYLMGQDNYPKNLNQAYNLLVNWQQDPQNMVHYGAGPNDGVVFAHCGDKDEQSDDEEGTTLVQETTRHRKSHITCLKWKRKAPTNVSVLR
jgi:hypothetical protein